MSSKYRISFVKEKKEYIKIKKYNKTFNFNSIRSYHESKNINNKYINHPNEYFGHIWTNWYDFLQVDISHFIQDKDDWIKFCKEKNVLSVNDYNDLCNIYNKLPFEPSEFYRFFTHLGDELDWDYLRRKYSL